MSPSVGPEEDFNPEEEYWIFGYGSLIWKHHSSPSVRTNVDRLPILIVGYLGL
jgi:cation transport regulator ChaC